MFTSTKIFIFAASFFYIIASVKSKDYELELNKYLITNFDNKYTKLDQNLQEGKDNLTFFNGLTGSGKGRLWISYYIQTKAGNDVGGVGICEKLKSPNKKNYMYLVGDIIVAGLLRGKKCPIEENETVQLENSFKVTSKAVQDIEGIIQLSMFLTFPPFYRSTVRYDVVGTVKAK